MICTFEEWLRCCGLSIRESQWRRARREKHSAFDDQFSQVNLALKELAEAQRRTEESIAHIDKRLDALIDIVRQQRNGNSNN